MKRVPYRQQGKSPCPNCGYEFDSFMGANTESTRPMLGDIGQCLECGDLHWFTAEGPVSLTKEEFVEALAESEDLRNVVRARSMAMEKIKNREAPHGA